MKNLIVIFFCFFCFFCTAANAEGDIERIQLYNIDGVGSMYDGLTLVSRNLKWGIIDSDGNIVIEPLYDNLYGFSEGLCGYQDKASGDYGYLDYNGNKIITNLPGVPGLFHDGIAGIIDFKGERPRHGFVNKNGEIIAQPIYLLTTGFSEGLASVLLELEQQFGFINTKGEMVLPPIYSGYPSMFKNGYASVFENGDYGYINKEGTYYTKDELRAVFKEQDRFIPADVVGYYLYDDMTKAYCRSWEETALEKIGYTFERDDDWNFYLLKNKSFHTEISVTIDDRVQEFDIEPMIVNGRTMVPFRRIFEEFGMEVYYDADTGGISAVGRDKTIQLNNNNENIIVNGNAMKMDVAPFIKDGRLLVPVRFISEAMEMYIEWRPYSKIVDITTNFEDEYRPEELPGPNYDDLLLYDETTYIDKYLIKLLQGENSLDKLFEFKTGHLMTVEEIEAAFGFTPVNRGVQEYTKIDIDNDGRDEVVAYSHMGGSAGFVNVFVCKENEEGEFEVSYSYPDIYSQNIFIKYNDKNYFVTVDLDYDSKKSTGLSVRFFKKGKLVELASINNFISEYSIYENNILNPAFSGNIEVHTSSRRLDVGGDYNLYNDFVGVLFEEERIRAEEIAMLESEFSFPNWFSGDINNDGKNETFFKQVFYPSTMSTVKYLSVGILVDKKILSLEEFCGIPLPARAQMLWTEKAGDEKLLYILHEDENEFASFYIDVYHIKDGKHEKVAAQTYKTGDTGRLSVYTHGRNVDLTKTNHHAALNYDGV